MIQNTNNMIILACQFLSAHLEEAQRTMGTEIPVIELDTSLHEFPEKMREKILEEISNIPKEYDTILVGMGFCGGSWGDVHCDRRVVIPRIDDCISILLTLTDEWNSNLKKPGCMYQTDNRNNNMTIPGMRENMLEKYGEVKGKVLFDIMFVSYRKIGIIDTGVYDSYSEENEELARASAELIGGTVEHVPGSNRILEKLVSGRWDDQFMILEPGETMREWDLFPDAKPN